MIALAGICARRRTYFLLLRQKKVSKEKATLLSVSPSLRYGRPALLGTARREPGNTGHRCARPRLRSARRLRPRMRGRAQRWPVSGCSNPCGCAWGGALAGWHGRPSAHASLSDLPRLSERSAQRAVSSAAHPASAPTQVYPVAQRRGRRLGVAFSLLTFFWRSKRK